MNEQNYICHCDADVSLKPVQNKKDGIGKQTTTIKTGNLERTIERLLQKEVDREFYFFKRDLDEAVKLIELNWNNLKNPACKKVNFIYNKILKYQNYLLELDVKIKKGYTNEEGCEERTLRTIFLLTNKHTKITRELTFDELKELLHAAEHEHIDYVIE